MNRDNSPPRPRKFCLSRSTMGMNGNGDPTRQLHKETPPCESPKQQKGKCTCPLNDGNTECVETCQTIKAVTKEQTTRWLPSFKLPSLSLTKVNAPPTSACASQKPPSPPPPKPPSPKPPSPRSASPSRLTYSPSSQCNASTDAIATSHYRAQLDKYKSEVVACGGDAAQLNCKLNDIFLKRLEDVDQIANGDTNLRLVTYQEWVELLLHINATTLSNINEMERETNQRIRNCFTAVNNDREDTEDENRKLRKDICTLIRIIQTAYNKNGWDFNDVHFETLDLNQVLGIPGNECPTNRPATDTTDQNVKALAAEIAEKYDEICSLRSQGLCLEKEIQTAHQKIILKDKTIACLREQVEEVEKKLKQKRQKSGCEICSRHKEIEERDTAVSKLNFLRDNLLDLDSFPDKSKDNDDVVELDQDSRVLGHLKNRLSQLSASNRRADLRCQELEIQMRGLQHEYEASKQMFQRNDQILKEIAETISNLNGVDFAYDSIYNGDNANPFRNAYIELFESRVARDSYDCLKNEKIDLHKTTTTTTTKASTNI